MNSKIVVLLLPATFSTFAGIVVGSLVDATAKVSVLVCLAIVVSLTMRRASAAMRHLVWLSTLGAALALPALCLCLPHWRVLPVWLDLTPGVPTVDTSLTEMATMPATKAQGEKTSLPQVHDASDTIVETSLSRSASIRTDSLSRPRNSLIAPALLTVWGLGTVTFLLRIARSVWTLRRFELSLHAVTSGTVATATQEIASELGVRSPVLYIGPVGAMPMVWGIRRGRIVLPAEATKWNAVQLQAVLLHEFAHLRRYDPLTQAIAQLARALHWFNPLVWLAVTRLQVEQEQACDDYVLCGGVNPSDYAGHLLDLATRLEPTRIAASVALAMTDRPRIEGRLRTILDATRNRRMPSHWLAGMTVLFAASATISLAMLHAADKKQPKAIRVSQPLRIRLIASADGSLASKGIVVDDRPMKGMDGFKKELEKIAAGRKGVLAIIIEADSSLRYQHLEQVINTASRAGFQTIELKPQGERLAEKADKPDPKYMASAKETNAGQAKDEKAIAGKPGYPKEKFEKDQERLMVQRKLLEVQLAFLWAGKTTLDAVLTAQKDLLELELEFAETSAQRIEIFERVVKTLTELDERMKEKVEGGVEAETCYLMTKAARLKAQSDLIRERARRTTLVDRWACSTLMWSILDWQASNPIGLIVPHIRKLVLLACLSVVMVRAESPAGTELQGKLAPFAQPPQEYAGKFGDYRSPLKFTDGTQVKSAEDWAKRRSELVKLWHERLGTWPPLVERPTVKRLESVEKDGYVQHHVHVQISPDGKVADGFLLIPVGQGPFPAVLVPFYEPQTSIGAGAKGRGTHDYGLQLVKRGFVTLSIGTPGSVEKVGLETRQLLIEAGKEQERQPLTLLAYVAANCHTALSQMPEVIPDRIGIIGLSYGGKWSMFASCLHEKFACAVWSDPGIVFNEKNGNVNYWEPWYLGRDPAIQRKPGIPSAENPRTGLYKKLVDNGDDLVDLHALMAPRPVLVSGGTEDPPRNWQALNHLIAVNEVLGQKNRIFMTARKTHIPTSEALEIELAFLEYWLKHGLLVSE